MKNKLNIKPKKKWYQRLWIWVIALIVVIVLINTIPKIVENISYMFMPDVTFTMDETYGNRIENTQPLGIYDVQIIERSNSFYIVGKIKKNSAIPEQSYIILDIELYDRKGLPVSSKTIKSEYKTNENKKPLNDGDIYEFEEYIYISNKNKKATQFKIIKLEEIDKIEIDAKNEAAAQEKAEHEAQLKSKIEQILIDNEFNGETAVKVIYAKEEALHNWYYYKYDPDEKNDGNGNYYIVSTWSNFDDENYHNYKVYEDGTYDEWVRISDDDLKKHKQATFNTNTLKDENITHEISSTENIIEYTTITEVATELLTTEEPTQATKSTLEPTTELTTILTGYHTQLYDNGDKYSGNFVNGIRSGNGTYEWENGVIYDGEFINGEPNGNGNYFFPTTEPPPTDKPTNVPFVTEDKSYVITETGEKYHYSWCSTIKRIKRYVTKAEAEAMGYEPCKRCNPK